MTSMVWHDKARLAFIHGRRRVLLDEETTATLLRNLRELGARHGLDLVARLTEQRPI